MAGFLSVLKVFGLGLSRVCVCVLVSKGSLLMVARSDTAELEAFEWGGVLML